MKMIFLYSNKELLYIAENIICYNSEIKADSK